MTDQRDKPGVEPDDRIGETRAGGAPAPISRRALMTGASVALPTILTLNSNAAFGWAVTSGTIGTRAANVQAAGDVDVICVVGTDTSGTPGGKTGVYEVQTSDFYRVRGVPYSTTSDGSGVINPELACEADGEIYYYADGTWNPTGPVGGFGGAVASVSLTDTSAMNSFSAGKLVPPENIWPL